MINLLIKKYATSYVEKGAEELNILMVPHVLEIVEECGGLTRQYAFSEDLDTIDEMVWVTPYTKRVTSGFRTSKRPNHNGIDIASPGIRGTPVLALTEGVVTISDANGTTFESDASDYRNGRSKGYGWYVEVDHGDGFKTRYAHLIEQGVPVGTEVKAGQIIGYVGSTGASTAPHLHFETIINGNCVDPMGIVDVFLEEET